MKTIICYPKPTASITISTWIIASHLEKQGYEVFYNEVSEGEDIDLESYFDQLALYCLEDCLTPQTIRKVVMSRHIIHSYSTDKTVIKNLTEALGENSYPLPEKVKHRVDFVTSASMPLEQLVWYEFYKDAPIPDLANLGFPQFNQLIALL